MSVRPMTIVPQTNIAMRLGSAIHVAIVRVGQKRAKATPSMACVRIVPAEPTNSSIARHMEIVIHSASFVPNGAW